MRLQLLYPSLVASLSLIASSPLVGCSDDPATVGPQATGGVSSGGGGAGGKATGGAPIGGTTGGTTGGVIGTGGTTGGVNTGGVVTAGGSTTGGAGGGGASGGLAGGGGRAGAGMGGGGAGGTVGGATTGGAGGEEYPPTFEIVKAIIESNEGMCLGVACHTDPANPLDLRLNDGLHTRLTTHKSEKCMNLPMVTPGKPEESAFLLVLKGPCGEVPQMPLGCNPAPPPAGTCLPDSYIKAVEQWIAKGAPAQ